MLETSLLTSQHIYIQLLRFVIVLFIGIIVTKTVFTPIMSRLISRNGDVKAKHSFENISLLIGLFLSFTLALQAANFGNLVTVLGTIAAAATVAVGFGMRDQVASVVAGIFIHTDNPFIKGDYIRVGDVEGVVKEIKMRATILNGKDQEKQIVPNNKLTSEVVKNYTKGSKTKASLIVKVPLDKLNEVSRELENLTKQQDSVLEKPEPRISNKDIEDNKAVIELNFWVSKPSQVKKVKSDIIGLYSKYFSENLDEEVKEE